MNLPCLVCHARRGLWPCELPDLVDTLNADKLVCAGRPDITSQQPCAHARSAQLSHAIRPEMSTFTTSHLMLSLLLAIIEDQLLDNRQCFRCAATAAGGQCTPPNHQTPLQVAVPCRHLQPRRRPSRQRSRSRSHSKQAPALQTQQRRQMPQPPPPRHRPLQRSGLHLQQLTLLRRWYPKRQLQALRLPHQRETGMSCLGTRRMWQLEVVQREPRLQRLTLPGCPLLRRLQHSTKQRARLLLLMQQIRPQPPQRPPQRKVHLQQQQQQQRCSAQPRHQPLLPQSLHRRP